MDTEVPLPTTKIGSVTSIAVALPELASLKIPTTDSPYESAIFDCPPPMVEYCPEDTLPIPPPTNEAFPEAKFEYPPEIVEVSPEAVFKLPPPIVEESDLITFFITS